MGNFYKLRIPYRTKSLAETSVPTDVERVLIDHPAVNACAVIGYLDAEWSEKVTAMVLQSLC
jgi:acyl-CoA synthetase (AMP-forming)/AMP-acid ligase II